MPIPLVDATEDPKAVPVKEFHARTPQVEGHPFPDNLFVFLGRDAIRGIAESLERDPALKTGGTGPRQ